MKIIHTETKPVWRPHEIYLRNSITTSPDTNASRQYHDTSIIYISLTNKTQPKATEGVVMCLHWLRCWEDNIGWNIDQTYYVAHHHSIRMGSLMSKSILVRWSTWSNQEWSTDKDGQDWWENPVPNDGKVLAKEFASVASKEGTYKSSLHKISCSCIQ